ncbi:MAG: HAMP domain-containing histidine kinase [Clostridia bacterium]|nr:HAMP domain-containing histidine kinase [Clostridia bacterium]
MFKSVFSKYFTGISLITLAGYLVMSGLHILLFTRSVAQDKYTLLQENADNIARQTVVSSVETQYIGDGHIVYRINQEMMTPFMRMMGDAIDATILLTDTDGEVLLCSDERLLPMAKQTALGGVTEQVGQMNIAPSTMNGLFEQPQYVAGAPLEIKDHTVGYVLVSAPSTSVWSVLGDNLKVYLMSALGALALSCMVVYLLTYRVVRPLRQMAAATRRFAQGDFSARVQIKGKDEMAQLGEALNHMAVSLSASETTRRSFVANVSHELKTPMTTITGFVDGILDGTIPPEKQTHYMQIVSDEVKRLSRLVRSMLDLSRIDSGELKMTTVRMDLVEALCSVLVASEQRIEQKRLRITGLEECEKYAIDGDYDLLCQVLYNLVDNAIKFTDEGGQIDIRLTRDSGRVHFTIRNTGAGIPAQEMPQIFERFYKSDRSRALDKNGMGLGLYIVKTVINLHRGEVAVRSVEGEFTEFSFWLPAAVDTP